MSSKVVRNRGGVVNMRRLYHTRQDLTVPSRSRILLRKFQTAHEPDSFNAPNEISFVGKKAICLVEVSGYSFTLFVLRSHSAVGIVGIQVAKAVKGDTNICWSFRAD